jgi:uroporphyrinogen III methyltransferase/synthase
MLTLGGARALADADLVALCGAELEPVLKHPLVTPKGDVSVTVLDGTDHAAASALLIGEASAGRVVVRLVSGDPLAEAGLALEAAACAASGCQLDIIPGVSALTAVPTLAGVSLHGAGTQFVSIAAGDDLAALSLPVCARLLVECHTAHLSGLARRAIACGWPSDGSVLVTVGGGSEAQRSRVVPLSALLGRAATNSLASLANSDRVCLGFGALSGQDGLLNCFETKPLFGWKVLVPRTRESTGEIEGRLQRYGASGFDVMTIAMEAPRNPQLLDKAVHGLVDGRYQWVVFTSRGAALAVLDRLKEYGLDARSLSGVRVAAATPGTTALLREWGITPDFVPARGHTGADLVAEFPAYLDRVDALDRLLLPRAEIATETIAEGLHALGWEVEEVTAYRTMRAAPPPPATREAIKTGAFDAVLFTSATAVRNLVGIAGKPPVQTVIAAIGPATANACAEVGLRVDVESSTPGQRELVDALAAFAGRRRESLLDAGAPVLRPSQTRRRRAAVRVPA